MTPAHVWGKTVREVDEILKAEVGDPKAQVMQIGPGAENGVLLLQHHQYGQPQ